MTAMSHKPVSAHFDHDVARALVYAAAEPDAARRAAAIDAARDEAVRRGLCRPHTDVRAGYVSAAQACRSAST